jgi:hypothetical protein
MQTTGGSKGVQVNFVEWYGGHRCPGSPRNPIRVFNLARRIAEEDFQELIEQDEVESLVIATLTVCFARFNPARGDQDIPEVDRFLRFFRHSFRRKLKDLAKDRVSRGRPKATLRYVHWKGGLSHSTRKDDIFADWAWFLFEQALRRLNREAQEYVKYRYRDGLTVEETASRMGVSRGQLRVYGGDGLARILRDEIGVMVKEVPEEDLGRLVYSFYYEDGFDEDEIASLFCLPVPDVVRLIRDATGEIICGLGREIGRSLFSYREKDLSPGAA